MEGGRGRRSLEGGRKERERDRGEQGCGVDGEKSKMTQTRNRGEKGERDKEGE